MARPEELCGVPYLAHDEGAVLPSVKLGTHLPDAAAMACPAVRQRSNFPLLVGLNTCILGMCRQSQNKIKHSLYGIEVRVTIHFVI